MTWHGSHPECGVLSHISACPIQYLIKSSPLVLILIVALFLNARTASALESSKPLKQYGRQTWQSDTGLPQNTVHSIVQSRDGFIWMATESGLVRFDGQDFRTFDTGNTRELTSNAINDLALDQRGTLWISTTSGIVKFAGNRFTAVTTANGLPSNIVRFTRPLRDGRIFAATASGIAVGDGDTFHTLSAINTEITPEQVAEDSAGTTWIAAGHQLLLLPADQYKGSIQTITDVGDIQVLASLGDDLWIGGRTGLIRLRDNKRFPVQFNGTSPNVTSLLPTSGDNVYIGTGAGLFEYNSGILKHLSGEAGTPTGRVLRLYKDREGSVWVAGDLTLSRIIPSAPGQLQTPLDISGALSIMEDREGSIWIGTEVGGANILREQAFSTVTTQDGLSDDFVRAVFQDHAGDIWLGTNRGGLNHITQGRISSLRAATAHAATALSSNVVLALAEAGGDLWIGTPDGLSRLHNGMLKLFTVADGLPDDFVRSLYTDQDGTLWIGTRNGLSHYSHNSFTSYSRLDGLGSDLIGSILRTRAGVLWVGTLDGLSRFDGSTFKTFTKKDGLAADAVTALTEDHEGTLWIASHAAGLTRLRNSVFVPLASSRGGLPQDVYSILEAAPQETPSVTSLWLGSSRGIYRVPLEALNAFIDHRVAGLPVESFGTADGLRISECSSGGHPAAWRMTDGTLWFATLKGVASVDPAVSHQTRIAPMTAIEDVLVDNQFASTDHSFIVAPGSERVAIHYAGLSFVAPQKLRFRYRLENFDRDWIDAGTRRTAFYTNIPAGKYRFLVYASQGNGIWSEQPGELQFTVRPHFYETLWFYCTALLLAALIAWFIYRARVRVVEKRYKAVLDERTRIAREIHDTLAQGYVGISVQLEVASRLLQTSTEATARQLETTKEYVRSSLSEARSSIWNLRSPGADSETLPARLAAAIKIREQSSNTAPAFRFNVHGTFRPIEPRLEDEFLKIALESIANSLRHASAATISVVLNYDTNWLKLAIVDDGKGFELGAVPAGHYGLQGMRERAAAIGASLRVHSKPDSGTTVELLCKLTGRKASNDRSPARSKR